MNICKPAGYESDIDQKIFTVRSHKVILDLDLAEMYGVTTKRLNEQVKRNGKRFPADFMFRLTQKEWDDLRSQIAAARTHGGRRYPIEFDGFKIGIVPGCPKTLWCYGFSLFPEEHKHEKTIFH